MIFVAWCPQVVVFVCKRLIFFSMNSDSPFLIGNNNLWLVISLLSVRDKTQELCTCDGRGKVMAIAFILLQMSFSWLS